MSDFSLAPVEAITTRVAASHWGQPPAHDQRQRRRQPRPGRARLLAAILPDVSPAECTVDYELDPGGEPVNLVVRDATSGRLLARVALADLAAMDAQAGLFFERRG